MNANALFSVTPRGGETILYIARSDLTKVQALQWNAEAGVGDSMEYISRPIVGREKREKHIPFVRVFGTCAEGTWATALLTLRMDNRRNLTFRARGPFSRERNLLFYQEFPVPATLCMEGAVWLTQLTGVNAEVWEVEPGYVEKA